MTEGNPVSDNLRQDIAGAIYDATGLRGEAWATASDVADEYVLADAVMAVVQPLVDERDRLKDEAVHYIAQRLALDEVAKHADALRVERDRLLWLHAEAVWQRDQLQVERDDLDLELDAERITKPTLARLRHADEVRIALAERHRAQHILVEFGGIEGDLVPLVEWVVDRCADAEQRVDAERESRFRWAEEAAHITDGAKALLDMEYATAPDNRLAWSAWPIEYNDLAVAIGWRGAKQPEEYTLDDLTMTPEDLARRAVELRPANDPDAIGVSPTFPADWRKRIGECESSGAAVDLVESWLPATVEAAPAVCEKCRSRGVYDPDRPGSLFGHFCWQCVEHCHDLSDESSVHMCVIDRWTPSAAGVSGTGTEASDG